ncbi:GreA/GreB family elongation factor [Pedobacter sp.]|uniref:GreA/GreB family elongation factor n=1 Tax=Pedobacter sp. TaxID=1411316 RepID=UPI003D7FC778
MNTTVVKLDQTAIILSRGIFDLLKSHIRTRKLSKYNEAKLELELKSATQVLRSALPQNIVDVNTRVRVKELTTGNEFTYDLVAPGKARRKHQTISILSPIGVAMLGYPEGAELQWEMTGGIKAYRITSVLKLNSFKASAQPVL